MQKKDRFSDHLMAFITVFIRGITSISTRIPPVAVVSPVAVLCGQITGFSGLSISEARCLPLSGKALTHE